MFTHILVPLDGSALSEAALPAAIYLAEKLAARVTLIHVIERHAPSQVHGQSHLHTVIDATAYLTRLAQELFPPETRVDFHVHTTGVENVAESIVAHEEEIGSDLVVMCSHGRGKALHLMLGSIAQKVIARGACPVLLIRPGTQDATRAAFTCSNILLPLDGTTEHEQAVPLALELARSCGSAIHFVMVIPGFSRISGGTAVSSRTLPGTTARMLQMASQDADQYLREQTGRLLTEGIEASGHVLSGDPAHMIVKAADTADMDMIVLATHGKSGMNAFWAGSVTNTVCSLSTTPLLLVPIQKT